MATICGRFRRSFANKLLTESRWSFRAIRFESTAFNVPFSDAWKEESIGKKSQIASRKLYDSHIPTSRLQKVLLTAGSALMGWYNPTRADMVAALGETTGHLALRNMRQRMLQDPVGQEILSERPRVNTSTVDIGRLRRLPDGLFGREYVRQLDTNRISPDGRDEVKFVDDEELAYVMQRYREVHDFVHTLAGLSIRVSHEVAVKWFEMIQTGLPMCVLSSFFAPVRLEAKERASLRKFYIPWAVYCGYQSKFFMNCYFERHFEEPIEDLRRGMNFIPAPTITA